MIRNIREHREEDHTSLQQSLQFTEKYVPKNNCQLWILTQLKVFCLESSLSFERSEDLHCLVHSQTHTFVGYSTCAFKF